MKKFLTFSFLLILLFLIYFLVYFYDLNEENSLNASFSIYQNSSLQSNESIQFSKKMRFPTENISFYFDDYCDLSEKLKMKKAFKILEEETRILYFFEASNLSSANIKIYCLNETKSAFNNSILGEGGPRKYLPLANFSLILEGEIFLYENKNSLNCELPVVELHELLHVLGFNHIADKNSIMHNFSSCNQKLDKEIITYLKEVYSQKAKSDILLEKLSIQINGNYLNFSVRLINQGLLEGKNLSLKISGNDFFLYSYNFSNLSPGEGYSLEVENLFINIKNLKNLTFFVENKEEEYSFENNKIVIYLNQ
ncbi:MAG: matrixin family metalloprotease [Candidatus Pacearchaeota archaeon]